MTAQLKPADTDWLELEPLAEAEEWPAPNIGAPDAAEDHLQRLAELQASLSWVKEHAQRQRAKADTYEEAESAKIKKAIAWHQQGLQAFLWNTGEKTLRLVHGTLKRIAARPSVVVNDEAAFIAWARDHKPELLRTKVEPAKKEILAFIKDQGELPDGIEIDPGQDSLSVSTT